MADNTKKRVFACFVNVEPGNKFWVNQHWVWDDDVPGLFAYETKEEKQRVADVAQSMIDNWGITKIELVTLEVKSRIELNLKKTNGDEIIEPVEEIKTKRAYHKKEEIPAISKMETVDDKILADLISTIPEKKKRGRPRKIVIMSL